MVQFLLSLERDLFQDHLTLISVDVIIPEWLRLQRSDDFLQGFECYRVLLQQMLQISYIFFHKMLFKKPQKQRATPKEEFEQFKRTLRIEYSLIDWKFGAQDAISPLQLNSLTESYLQKKLYKQPKEIEPLGKCIAVCQDDEMNSLFTRTRRTQSVVSSKIKGKNYFLALGQLQNTCRTTSNERHRRMRLFSGRTESVISSYRRPRTSEQIIQECSKLVENSKREKQESAERALVKEQQPQRKPVHYMKPYKTISVGNRTYNHKRYKREHINNLKFIEKLGKDIKILQRGLEIQPSLEY